ncbi:unnamed protein product [Linum trigynum]|uniref:Uncharacterized protein n=1 Tax=Linum trigynum TaxID=586398 RepID=A0AAV2EBN2_9ROSI
MEKSRSFPQYSSSFSGEFGPFDDWRRRAVDHNKTYSFLSANSSVISRKWDAQRSMATLERLMSTWMP